MSTYWGLRCITDGEETCSGTPTYGKAYLRNLMQLAPWLKALEDAAAPLPADLFEVKPGYWWGEDGEVSLITFLIQHASHVIVLVNEYGDTEPADESEASAR